MKKVNCSLTVVIPCYNEKDTIGPIVDKVLEAPIQDLEVIVVDNCSTDGTRELLREQIETKVHKVIYNEVNIGKGGSLQRGFRAATKDIVIVQDADLEYDPVKDYPRLVQPIIKDKADVVYGSRFRNPKNERGHWLNYLGNQVFTRLSNRMTGLKLTDVETCYKTFRREIIQGIELKESGFGFEPEVTAKVAATGCRVMEIPIDYYPRKTNQGKKVKFRHGLLTIYCIFKYRKYNRSRGEKGKR